MAERQDIDAANTWIAVFQSSSYWRMAERQLQSSRWKVGRVVSILIILANGWKRILSLTGSNEMHCFNPHHTGEWLKEKERNYWRDQSVGVSILIILANGWKENGKYPVLSADSFNPHHTGEWLKAILTFLKIEGVTQFQSSSYWRMAESEYGVYQKIKPNCFNPHHTGEWLKEAKPEATVAVAFCFNPHHTGEWLKVTEWVLWAERVYVSILIILANGWKK